MKVRVGEGKQYEVDPLVLDYLTLKYGQRMLEQYRKMDSTLQFGMKIVTKQVVKELLKAFNVPTRLPRGTDPTEFLIRGYILLMRESLDMLDLELHTDEQNNVIYDSDMEYVGIEAFSGRMNLLLERLKSYAANEHAALSGPGTAEADSDRARPELVASGEEAEWEDDGGEDAGSQFPLFVS